MPQQKSTEVKKNLSDDPSSVNFQCIDAIEASLCIEKEGLRYYERAAREAGDPKVKEIFTRLAKEEKEHIQLLQDKARFLQPALFSKSGSRNKVSAFIAQELKGKIFPLVKGMKGNVSDARNDVQALDFGIESEKRSVEVLQKLLAQEKKLDVRVIFSHLMVEEKKHLAALEKLKESILSRKVS